MGTFNKEKCFEIIRSGEAEPVGGMAPFINVDRAKYDKLRKDTTKKGKLNMPAVKQRVDRSTLADIRGATSLTLRHASKYFPAYRFLAGEFINEEWLSMVDWHKPFHRDHIIHQSMTAVIGMWLLSRPVEDFGNELEARSSGGITLMDSMIEMALRPGGKAGYLVDYLKRMDGPDVCVGGGPAGYASALWESMAYDAFFLTAMFHDMGYPWKFVNEIHKNLSPHEPLDNPANLGAKWIAENYCDRLAMYPLHGYKSRTPDTPPEWKADFHELARIALSETHGLPGAISLLHLNDVLRDKKKDAEPVRRFCVEWAAMAVMMHDMAGVYCDVKGDRVIVKHPDLRLTFERDPLSCLMTLCDLIQSFDRPNANFSRVAASGGAGDEIINVRYGSKCVGTRLDWNTSRRELTITYLYEDSAAMSMQRALFNPEEQLKFFDPKEGYLDLRAAGINTVKFGAEMAP